MLGRKHPQDEGVYVTEGRLGEPSVRVAATRQDLERARQSGLSRISGLVQKEWGMTRVSVDVDRAWADLVADDKRLGRR